MEQNENDYNIVFNDEIADLDYYSEDEECQEETCDTSEEEHEHNHHCDCHNHTHVELAEQSEKYGEDVPIKTKEQLEQESKERAKAIKAKYKDYEFEEAGDDTCEFDDKKICDNCGKCLGQFNTDDRGYVQIGIDKVDKSNTSLDQLYKMYNLNDED